MARKKSLSPAGVSIWMYIFPKYRISHALTNFNETNFFTIHQVHTKSNLKSETNIYFQQI